MDSSNTLFTVHVIADLASYRDKTVALPSGVTNISFEIAFNDNKAISSLLYALTFEEKLAGFSLTIRFTEGMSLQPDPKWLSQLASLLIDAGYFKIRDRHLLFLEMAAVNSRDALKNLLQRLEQLGFGNIFMAGPGNAGPGYQNADDSLQLVSFEDFIAVGDLPALILQPDKIVHVYTTTASLIKNPGLAAAFEKKLSGLDDRSRKFILLFNQLRKKLDDREERIGSLQESVKSKEDYLKFLLHTPVEGSAEGGNPIPLSEIQKIRSFYHYEYEILPLWYKRFGHIVKVVIGKRTFKSLFNDEVKKYKN